MNGIQPKVYEPLSRRDALRRIGGGFGSLALAGLLAEPRSAAASAENPLAPKAPHFHARAKRVIFLFMEGGPSHHDTFDYKPLLVRDQGKPLPMETPRVNSNPDRFGKVLGPLAQFKQRGASGIWVSDFFPKLAQMADELCVINSMHCSNTQHGAAVLELHTGHGLLIRPSMGSWITYGLGTENQKLPGYITICQPLTLAGTGVYSSAFLPAAHQGTPLGYRNTPSAEAKFRFIQNKSSRLDLQRAEMEFVREAGEAQLARTGPDSELEARIRSFELAFQMQMEAPEVQDVSKESAATKKLYGLDQEETRNLGYQCLLARRFAERGVRFVQCNLGGWDLHNKISSEMPKVARQADQPIAALIEDLKARGLLEDTLVLWGGEFGRTPVTEGPDGRDHNPYGYTMWMAGAGIKKGTTYGRTDDYGYYAVEDKVHVHDLHATILHLLGLDHTKLTYPYAGRNFRLTDVHGEVVKGILS